ncbi:uncharacterized protein RCC_03862 [Ramularia collo-cygni]|uniref:Zinc finger C2H2 LYAR-type domain-containing protein n=1 Tax=Ramularia collo-cygni TaxID=112498 RepID=A0A2D3V675_9PEZI|nr:uncharacterized protein RCC_03862 [Ramularia collo-cygni]CZT18024.1 uncharacterized protein RCC_03862 [Ramularia collo-cygni]
MVSFSCEACGDVLTKKKLDPHRNQCYGATYTCLDCMVHFYGTDYRSHTSCISEAQKYQGHLYKEKSAKGNNKTNTTTNNNNNNNNKRKSMEGMVPRGAYVEDAPEGDEMNMIAVIDVPPRAPTPPPAPDALENINVFDFLVSDATPKGAVQAPEERRRIEHTTPSGDSQSQYQHVPGAFNSQGWSYGNAPIEPSFQRWDSYNNLTADSQETQAGSLMPPPNSFITPASKEQRKKDRKADKSTDKKRKRIVEELDLSTAKRPQSRDEHMEDVGGPSTTSRRVLHSGLTGGLTRLVTDPDFYEDRIDAGPTPISPIKRRKEGRGEKESTRKVSGSSKLTSTTTKHSHRDRDARSRSPERGGDRERRHRRSHHRQRSASVSSVEERRRPPPRGQEQRALEYPIDRPSSVQPTANNQLMGPNDRADHFLSFITKGPESERGCSINKILKRYHRERDVRGSEDKEDEDKELWKGLRLRRNSRGEVVVFV